MGWNTSNLLKLRVLCICALIVGIFDALLVRNVVSYDVLSRTAVRVNVEVPATPNHDPISLHATLEPAPAVLKRVGIPVRIKIPSIALDARIEKVALTKDGSMDVPKKPLNTGWYSLGPRPGETGSATIAGHVDWLNGATAVFADLRKVKPGDTIVVQDDNGQDVDFVVRESRKYDAEAEASDVFISRDGKAHLNLITCDGVWDKRANQYSNRLVVFADRKLD